MTFRPLLLSALSLMMILMPVAHADPTIPQTVRAHRDEMRKRAEGASGFLAIQSFVVIQAGETAYLVEHKDPEQTRVSKDPKDKIDGVHVTFDGKAAQLIRPGEAPIDLVAAPNRQQILGSHVTLKVKKPGTHGTTVFLINPLRAKVKGFKDFEYFPYSSQGAVAAKLEHLPDEVVTYVDTWGTDSKSRKLGTVHFKFAGKDWTLPAYTDSLDGDEIEEMDILFTDRTSGKSTYGGGRVVTVKFTDGHPTEKFTLDFNQAYIFPCAYASVFRCPLRLTQKIDAEIPYGEKLSRSLYLAEKH